MQEITERLLRKKFDPTIFRVFVIVALFVVILISTSAINLLIEDISNGVRSYTRGEGLWAKGQKEATFQLLKYTYKREAAAYENYENAIQVNLGDHQARLALQLPHPDLARASAGFLTGQNDPEDINALITFFLHFHAFPYMSDAIVIWTEADQKIAELIALAGEIKTVVETGGNERHLETLREKLGTLNEKLLTLEPLAKVERNSQERCAARIMVGCRHPISRTQKRLAGARMACMTICPF
jgi:hypothetical protein